MVASKKEIASRAQDLTDKVRESRFGQDVFGPKIAQPLAHWLNANFGASDDPAHEADAALGDNVASSEVRSVATIGAISGSRSSSTTGAADLAPELEADVPSAALDPAVEPAVDDAELELDITPSSPKDVLTLFKALGQRIKNHNLVVVAAGIAFWGLLAIPAILFAVVSIAGLVLDPAKVKDQVSENLSGLPEEAQEIIGGQLESVSGSSTGGLITGLVVGVVLALWTASGAMAKLMGALNTIYGATEARKFAKLRGTAVGLTFGGIVFISSAVFLLAALPALLGSLSGVGDSLATLFNVLRFPVLGLVMVIGLGVLYHLGPDRSTKYRPLTAGAVVAMVLWIGLSALFSIYTATIGSYNETYGSIGGIVILLLWLFITAFVVLLGAEIHAESEQA